MTKEILRERFKAKSAGQSLHQVTVNVGFTKSNKIDGCNCPNPMLERCQGLGFLKLFNNPSSTSDREYWQLHLLDVKWSTNNGMIQKTCAVSGHAGRTFLFLQWESGAGSSSLTNSLGEWVSLKKNYTLVPLLAEDHIILSSIALKPLFHLWWHCRNQRLTWANVMDI